MSAIVFGANGQDGHYLIKECQNQGILTIGVSRSGGSILGDVGDREFVESLVRDFKPDYVFHLAANSSTRHEVMHENNRTICTGTLNVLESVYRLRPECRIFIVGSGLQFENRGVPIRGDEPWALTSAYAMSRVQSVLAARYYRSLGLRTYVGYLFHHESPLRGERHVSQKIALATRRIQMGSSERIDIGDLTVEKEWTFAGDVVRGILALVQQDAVTEAVIGSGIGYTIRDWLEFCFKAINKNWEEYIQEVPALQSEYSRLVSDPSTMLDLGWKASVQIETLARIMVLGQPNDEE